VTLLVHLPSCTVRETSSWIKKHQWPLEPVLRSCLSLWFCHLLFSLGDYFFSFLPEHWNTLSCCLLNPALISSAFPTIQEHLYTMFSLKVNLKVWFKLYLVLGHHKMMWTHERRTFTCKTGNLNIFFFKQNVLIWTLHFFGNF